MFRAILHDADLTGAGLRRANLRAAHLEAADLAGADLTGASLRRARLQDADLTGARLLGADLVGARLMGAKVTERQLGRAVICHTHLPSGLSDRDCGHVAQRLRAARAGAGEPIHVRARASADACGPRPAVTKANCEGRHLDGINAPNLSVPFCDCAWATFDNSTFENIDFDHSDMYFASFVGAALPNSDFSGSALFGTTFRGANLSGANLAYANPGLGSGTPPGTSFNGANLNGAVLLGSNWYLVQFMSAKLRGANFTGANLRSANLSFTDLTNANLTGADTTGMLLDGAILCATTMPDGSTNDSGCPKPPPPPPRGCSPGPRAVCTSSYDPGLTSTKEDWSSSDFAYADWNGANLAGSDFSSDDFYLAQFMNANLSRANLHEARLFWANFTGANLANADLSGLNAGLDPATATGTLLNNADLSEANLAGANLHAAQLINADLRDANLSNANLTSANLNGANLDGADLDGANLAGAQLTTDIGVAPPVGQPASLQRANLQDVFLSHANFDYARMTMADLRGVVGEGPQFTGTTLIATNWLGAFIHDATFGGADFTGALLGVYMEAAPVGGFLGTPSLMLDNAGFTCLTKLPDGTVDNKGCDVVVDLVQEIAVALSGSVGAIGNEVAAVGRTLASSVDGILMGQFRTFLKGFVIKPITEESTGLIARLRGVLEPLLEAGTWTSIAINVGIQVSLDTGKIVWTVISQPTEEEVQRIAQKAKAVLEPEPTFVNPDPPRPAPGATVELNLVIDFTNGWRDALYAWYTNFAASSNFGECPGTYTDSTGHDRCPGQNYAATPASLSSIPDVSYCLAEPLPALDGIPGAPPTCSTPPR